MLTSQIWTAQSPAGMPELKGEIIEGPFGDKKGTILPKMKKQR